MKGFSAYLRKNRPAWYISYLSAETQHWKHEATDFLRSDPLGQKKALRLAEQKAAAYFASVNHEHKGAWTAWVPDFIRDRHRNSENTRERYLDAWDNIRAFIVQHRIPHPGQTAYRHAPEYIAWRTAQKKHSGTPITRNTALYELKVWATLMHEAVRRGWAMGNPIAHTGERKDPPKETPALTADDIAKWRAALAVEEGRLPLKDRWRTIAFEMALHQGCRLRETSVPMDAIDLERGTIRMKIKGANGRPREHIAPIHPAIMPMLRELKAEGVSHTCTLPKMASKLLWQFRGKHGLGHTKFHSTRVTVITEFAKAGVPEQQAMAYVAHSSRAVHRIYQRLRPEDLSACTAALQFSPKGTSDAPERTPAPTTGTPLCP